MPRSRVSLVGAWALAVCAGGWTVAARANDDEILAKYLNRLGLVDLQTVHLEQQVDAASAGDVRRKLAERLADLYSAQLIDHADDRARYDAIVRRIQRLVERVPEAKTASL